MISAFTSDGAKQVKLLSADYAPKGKDFTEKTEDLVQIMTI
jgi:hypothetical protein